MRFPRVLSLCCAALLLALGLALPCRADSLEDAARALARDIAEKTGAGAARISLRWEMAR
jgi:predicted secreted protein